MKKSTLLHLRIPFSFFLLPVFLLAAAVAPVTETAQFWLAFFILHLLVYPASNGYNSYFDKDEESIGGLKNPPKVEKELYWMSLFLDGLALLLGLLISLEFTLMIFIYGLVSKAYSHPAIRLKKRPIIGWLAAGLFQGYFTFILSFVAITDGSLSETWNLAIQLPGILSTLLLLGSYPMTQIYQHKEDKRRGDLTISRQLGILGTFHFTAISFLFSSLGFFLYFERFFSVSTALLFLLFMSPVLLFFNFWYFKVRKDANKADFMQTMRLNLLSSLALNGYFLYLIIN